MEKFVLRFGFSRMAVAGVSAVALLAACSSSSPGASQDSGGTSSGGSSTTGGASSTGGTTASGGTTSPGGAGTYGGAGGSACVLGPPQLPTDVPTTIAAPEGATLIDWFNAVGTQNYVCTATSGQGGAGPTYAWVFVAPKADLLDRCGTKVGSHFAAPNTSPPVPEWKYEVDGSSVTGTKVAASPVPDAIPELLLAAADHFGTGLFSSVSNVQRLHTAGGVMPPAADCDADHVDEERDVGYSARYYFYSGAPDGGTQ